jgi:hypothetical protein
VAHIDLPSGLPGTRGLQVGHSRAETGRTAVAEALLCAISSLAVGERALIITFLSVAKKFRVYKQSQAVSALALVSTDPGIAIASAVGERAPSAQGATGEDVAREAQLVSVKVAIAATPAAHAQSDSVLIAESSGVCTATSTRLPSGAHEKAPPTDTEVNRWSALGT